MSTTSYNLSDYFPVRAYKRRAASRRGRGNGAGSGSSRSTAVVRSRVARGIKPMQLYMVKDSQGNRVDRQYKEAAIRKDWTIADPRVYSEPTSRANVTSWITPRNDATTNPTVDADPRDYQGYYDPTGGTDKDEALRQIGFQQHSSFIATRSGLCRIKSRTYVDAAAATLTQNEVVPWGASTTYPNPFNTGVPSIYTFIHPTDKFPCETVGSGCLPIFFMDQPSPFIMPMAGVERNVGRFGNSVRSKFRELNVVIEEFPYSGSIDAGKWSQTTSTLRTNGGFQTMPERESSSVRIIIFKRKRGMRNPDPGQAPLKPPVFPPVPAGAYREGAAVVDQTWDVPSNGESVMKWPSSVPGSPYQIIEDTVMEFPKFKPTGRGYNTGAATIPATAGGHDAAQLFKSYGTANPMVSTTLDATSRASRSYMDADGLPHTNRRIVFKRRYKDMGNRVAWNNGGSTNVSEGISSDTTDVPCSNLFTPNTDPTVIASDSQIAKIDLCDDELFITVLTGAYLDLREFDLTAITPVTCDTATYATYDEQLKRGWHISPLSVCHPALVSIETKWWYADEAIQGRPDQFRIVDNTGADTGHSIVMDRPDPYLPYEVPQTDE